MEENAADGTFPPQLYSSSVSLPRDRRHDRSAVLNTETFQDVAALVIKLPCGANALHATAGNSIMMIWYWLARHGMTISGAGLPHYAISKMSYVARAYLVRELTLVLSVTVLWLASVLAGCAHGRNQIHPPDPDPGRTRFETYCAGCHLNEGPWMRGEAPPLEGSYWVAGPENRVIKIVLHGLRGPIKVGGKPYNQEMPGFGPILTDTEIASLLSYVRKRFGGASTPVSEAAVSLIRTANRGRMDYWTVDELLREP